MESPQHMEVWKELKQIHRRLETLEDAILSPDDREALKEARKEFREGKTVSHERVAKKFH
ncbi:MAG: hypothetical protein FJ358_02060 [Thaumarchaeota archaeon]|nr:hypothetical protein [Nitrososphaerota archaeon]